MSRVHQADVVIVGGGLAGSTAAAMLARAGWDVALVDLHAVYPPELRCEKLDGYQVRLLCRTGLADAVLAAGTFDRECWVARAGRLVGTRPGDQYGILYDTLVNTMRSLVPPGARLIIDKVTAIRTSAQRQQVTLAGGQTLDARLVIVANGLNASLGRAMGLVRQEVSRCHSVTVAFDLRPVDRQQFDFHALTYYGERVADRVAYLTLFPIGAAMHANLMVYRGMDHPWIAQMRHDPGRALAVALPGLRKLIGQSEVVGPVRIRPADLYVARNHLQPGMVLVGDAFATSCPAAGTGAAKVFTDVERLCHVHLPRWMASPGMGSDKIEAFYADPNKVACDNMSLERAFSLRSDSIDDSLSWRVRSSARPPAGTVKSCA